MILCEKHWAWIAAALVAAGVKLSNTHDNTAVGSDDDVYDDKYQTMEIITQLHGPNGPWDATTAPWQW